MKYKYFFIVVLLGWACNKEYQAPMPLYRDYYPMAIGDSMVYAVDSIDMYRFPVDTNRFEILEVVDSQYIDDSQNDVFKSYLYKKSIAGNWIPYRAVSTTIKNGQIERFEDNFLQIKVIFPLIKGEKWLGNSLQPFAPNLPWFSEGAWNFEYITVHKPFDNGYFVTDSAAYVLQIKDESLINTIVSNEYYGNHIGLLSAYFEYTETQGAFTEGVIVNKKLIWTNR
jgi:hypothetical protein